MPPKHPKSKLDNFTLREAFLNNNIKSPNELLALANTQKDLTQQKTSFQIATDSMNSECDRSHNGQWLTKCPGALDKNDIVRHNFSDALFNLIN